MTSQRLLRPGSLGPLPWDELRQSSSLGLALWNVNSPRLAAADPAFSIALGRGAGAFGGVLASELEPGHSFARSVDTWREHVEKVRELGSVEWATWLKPVHGLPLRALLCLRVRVVLGSEYLVGELLELARPAQSRNDDPRLALLDELPNGACRITPEGRLLASNAAAMPFLERELDGNGASYRLRLPRTWISTERELLAERDLPWFRALREHAVQPPTTLGLTRPDGTLIWALTCVSPELGSLGSGLDLALITFTDVTATKEAADVLREADRKLRRTISSVNNLQDQLARSEHMASLGLMAAGVAHEINNPLSYILSNLSFAAERAIDQESRSALREALEGAGRVRDIVRDLKTLSRMESEEDIKPVDPRNAVDAALKLAFDEVRNRARVQRHFSEVPHVLGNETRLVQVMLNLVTNAAHSIPPGAPDSNQITVEVRPAQTEGEVEIVVADTGAGISEAHLPKVFEPFFTTKPAGEGTGLGLSICHRLIYAMGGRIHVSSEEGRGSTFSIFLAAARVAQELEIPTPELTSSARRRRLLIVDDEVLVARAVRRMFEKDFGVEIALDGHAALEKLNATDYDVVLCDVMMPGITGLDVYRQVRSANEALARRFVFATGGLFSQELSDSVKRLSNMIVEKPFDPAELRRVIHAAVPEPRSTTSSLIPKQS